MSYIGDFAENYATLNFKFTTRNVSGVPTGFDVTSPIASLKVYKANGVGESISGITFTTNFDAVTGLHNVLIDLSAGGSPDFYQPGNDYQVVIAVGTVNSVSVVGEMVASFSIENRSSSLNAIALAGLEDQFDGTGVVGDNYPATQAALGNLSTGSSAISKRATLGTVNVGTVIGGTTYTNTYTLDGVFHSITEDVSGNFDVEYGFEVGGNGVGSEIVMDGYFSGNGDVLQVQAYNWIGATWENIGTVIASSGSDVGESRFVLDIQHTGIGVNLGKVQIRGYEAGGGLSSVQLNMDRVRIDYSIVSQSVGYANAAIWINTINGTAGTETHVNGIADKKVLTLADAITLNSVLHLDKFNASPDSSITFAESHTNEVWEGEGWLLGLGGQDISGTHIYHCNDISGIGTTPAGECHILDSHMGALTLGQCHITGGSFSSTFDAGAAGAYNFENVHSGVEGSGVPVLTFSGLLAATTISARGWMGGGSWVFDSDCIASIEVLLGGSHTITTGGGDIEFRGSPKSLTVTTSGTGETNIVIANGAPIVVNGAAGTVNVYGIHGGITGTYSESVTDFGADITDIPNILLDSADLQANQGNWLTATGFSTHGAADVRTEMDANSVDLNSILANQTTIAGLITALNDLSAAQVNAECDTAITDAALATAAALAALNNISVNDILTTQMTEAYAANGVAPTMAQSLFAIHQMLMQFGISGTSWTIRRLDNSTTAFVVTLDDAINPTDASRT